MTSNSPSAAAPTSEADAAPRIASAPLERSLSSLETWGFGLSGLLLWLGPAPAMHAELGAQAIWVWLPGAIVGTLLNLQVKKLGAQWPDVAGGTPNYLTRLLRDTPNLALYSALGYFLGWAAVPMVNAIILTDLVNANLQQLGLHCPDLLLELGFTTIAFVVALSGTRALGILHVFFIVPALGLLLVFCVQGMGWLLVAPESPGFLPPEWVAGTPVVALSFGTWAKWFVLTVYAVYACETAASFVADSRKPNATLNCLPWSAGLIPIIYVGGSWVLMRLSAEWITGPNAFLNLLSAATPFWGAWADLLVTFLIVSGCLLSCATAFSNTPRILYQLAQDGYLSPLFGIVSRRQVLAPALVFTLILSCLCVAGGDVSRIVMVTGTGYFWAIAMLHLGLGLHSNATYVGYPRWAIAFFGFEAVAFVVGGLAWGWFDFALGLALPALVMLLLWALQQLNIEDQISTFFTPSQSSPSPGTELLHPSPPKASQDFVVFQVTILLALVCTTAIAFWSLQGWLQDAPVAVSTDLFVVALLTIAFVGIAIACWTTLPQMGSIEASRLQMAQLAEQATLQAQALEQTLQELRQTQTQLIQTEKMSALGQLMAGVAHEINNPVNFIRGNLSHARCYLTEILELLELYQTLYHPPHPDIQDLETELDIDFLLEDFPRLLDSMDVGSERICEIVLSLRNFARSDEVNYQFADLHVGLDDTLLILQNRLKANGSDPEIKVIKQYGELPPVECLAGQLNQVFMNILSNAIDALREAHQAQDAMPTSTSAATIAFATLPPPRITITTEIIEGDRVQITLQDNGPGIPPAVKAQLFEAFFTTKPVGKGTGLGLSISQQIVAEKHQGTLACVSESDAGTTFIIELPIQRSVGSNP